MRASVTLHGNARGLILFEIDGELAKIFDLAGGTSPDRKDYVLLAQPEHSGISAAAACDDPHTEQSPLLVLLTDSVNRETGVFRPECLHDLRRQRDSLDKRLIEILYLLAVGV